MNSIAASVSVKRDTLKSAIGDARLPNGRWTPLELAFWLLPLAAYFLFPGYQVFISQMMILALFALSLDLILGYAGIVSLGHAAFFGIGAYAAGLLALHGWNEPLTGLIVAAVAAAIVGYLCSFVALRGGDLTRLMITLGIGLVLFEAANKATSITGGVDGLSGIAMGRLLGRFDFDINGNTAYWYCLAILFIVFLGIRRVVASPFGLSLVGIREGGNRMPAIGANVEQRLRIAFTIGAAVAGVAGALMTQTTQFVSLEALSFTRSSELMVILVLGGAGRLYGGLVGAIAFMVAQDHIANLNPVYWQFWLGILLILIVLVARGGILGGLAWLFRRAPFATSWRARE